MRGRLSDPRFPRFVQALEIFTNETDVQINVIESEHAVARRFYEWCESKQAIEYQTSFGTFRVSSRSFFQVNRFLVEKLVEAALARAGRGIGAGSVRRRGTVRFADGAAIPLGDRGGDGIERRARSGIQRVARGSWR